MITLAIDTASIASSVALLRDSHCLAMDTIELGKGHAEKLLPQIQDVMKKAGLEFSNLDKIAVNIGPGSFTGIRVGVSTARAFKLALQKPAIGISAFMALAYEAKTQHRGMEIAVIMQAYQDNLYAQFFDANGIEKGQAICDNIDSIVKSIPDNCVLIGSAAAMIAPISKHKVAILMENQWPQIITIGLLGEQNHSDLNPSPLYLREPDAKPQSGFALERK